jgi:hypothetical protein
MKRRKKEEKIELQKKSNNKSLSFVSWRLFFFYIWHLESFFFIFHQLPEIRDEAGSCLQHLSQWSVSEE